LTFIGYECPVPQADPLVTWLRPNGAPALVPNRAKLHAPSSVITGPVLLVGFMLHSLVHAPMRPQQLDAAGRPAAARRADALVLQHSAGRGHERHVRTCLAVRHASWGATERPGFGRGGGPPVS
jgi:hypothetical protein